MDPVRELPDLVVVAGRAGLAPDERVLAVALVLDLRVRVLRVLGVAGSAVETRTAVDGSPPGLRIERHGTTIAAPKRDLLVG
jgi:hypothetical protein